jgi:hypothetical protein
MGNIEAPGTAMVTVTNIGRKRDNNEDTFYVDDKIGLYIVASTPKHNYVPIIIIVLMTSCAPVRALR